MRKLLWFTVGFAAACGIGAYLVSDNWLLLLALFCFAGLIAAAFLFQERGKGAVLVCFGLTVAFVWLWIFDNGYLSYARKQDGQLVETTVTVTDYSRPTEKGVAVTGTIDLEGRAFKINLYRYETEALNPGDILHGRFQIYYTRGEKWSDYYSSSGIYLIGYADDSVTVTHLETIPDRHFPVVLRRNITDLLDQIFPADTLAFARGLLIGDSSLLDYETDQALTVSGIKHIVAVSGQHVSILFCVIFALFGYRRVVTPLVGFPVLLLFAALTGFTPSVNRACIMQALMLLALMLDKEYDPPTALAFSVLVMLVVNPMTIASVGFQLSVGCLIGIFLFSGKISGYLLQEKRFGTGKGKSLKARLARWAASGISITLSTMIVTTPLCAICFGMVSLVGILTNLLTLWAVSLVFYGIIAACVLGAVWLPLGSAIAWLISWLIRYVLLAAKLLSSLPMAAVYTTSGYIVAWLVFCYVLLGIFFLQKQKQTAMLLCCVLLSLSVAIGASWLEPAMEDYRVTVLDVGQGQCILIRKDNKNYIIDCGGDSSKEAANLAVSTLLSQGVTKIDGLILTHYDKDHAGGVPYLLSRIPADHLYLPDIPDSGTLRQTLVTTHYSRITWIGNHQSLVLEDGMLQLFGGDGEKSENESSLCILCRVENCDILITGDRNTAGEKTLLDQAELPDLEVLIAGHHGSAYSTGRELLKATMPELAIVSAGRSNAYRHPAPTLVERLTDFGCQILCTNQNGTIVIRG